MNTREMKGMKCRVNKGQAEDSGGVCRKSAEDNTVVSYMSQMGS